MWNGWDTPWLWKGIRVPMQGSYLTNIANVVDFKLFHCQTPPSKKKSFQDPFDMVVSLVVAKVIILLW
jgi:hypothetical protein